MEGRAAGIAMEAGRESGHGPFGPGVPMTGAAKEYYRSPPSSPSPSTSPTPSPPAAATTPLAWSLGAAVEESSRVAAGDGGAQTAGGQGDNAAGFSSGRRRGRPRGSGRRQILASLGEWYALSAGGSFTPHVIIVGTGEDVASRVMSFSQKGPRSVCILSANGLISNVTLRQPDSSGNFTYEGRFEILQLMGSFTMAEEGRRRTGGLSVSLAGPDGRVVGGVVAGMLRAAGPIQVIVGSFLPNSLKQHQRRMNLQQQQPPPAPALPALMAPPPVLTAAMPISQATPGNGFHAPPPPSAAPQQAHASAEHSTTGMNMNLNTAGAGFTMLGWPPSSQSMAHGSSPDINVSLAPQE